ncbi:MAG: hypothetical protein H0V17_36115 [Deltaproteobacteria bacterium]|nr:hypothetical protein [Deltaproteobacteria bacterium]
MNLVEAESIGPIEGDTPLVTPPRPPHRRVSVSLLFTLTVLVGTVVAIYLRFPTRNTVLMEEALQRHQDQPAWDLVNPTAGELRAWAIGVVGRDPPLPRDSVTGARDLEVLGHRAAMIRFVIDGEPITYLVQFTRVIAPEFSDHTVGDLHAIAWRQGLFTCAAVGPEATSKRWSRTVQAAVGAR